MGQLPYESGKFHPMNPEKYKGNFPIVYRSNWEKQLMMFLDRMPACVSWGSESCVVRYNSPIDKQIHRYFIDFTATFIDKMNIHRKYYIEIKPKRQTIPPVQSKRKAEKTLQKEMETYLINTAKWKAAQEYAKSKGAKFIIMTEEELFKNTRQKKQ